MNTRGWRLVAVVLVGLGTASVAPAQQEAGNRVEIVIESFSYRSKTVVLKPDQPAVIRLYNNDAVEHGFISPALSNVDVRVETDAGSTFGRGITGVHILPGEELTIHLLTPPPGQYSFHCDLHPGMKGELVLLTVGTA